MKRSIVMITIPLYCALVVALLGVGAVAASAAKSRDAEASSTVQDASGLMVERTWKIDAADPRTLTADIRLHNDGSAPVTTTLVEPIPAASLQRIKFRPAKLPALVGDGIARIDVSLPSGSSLDVGYTARLTRDRKANAQDRLAIVQGEMENTLASAQPTDADRAIAAMADRYFGSVEVREESASNVTLEQPTLGERTMVSLRVNADPQCRVVARGCRLPAQDSFVDDPVLSALEPFGHLFVAEGSADLADTGMTCDGATSPGLNAKRWTVEPSAWQLGWEGWTVSQVQYTVVGDLTSPAMRRCLAGSLHTVITGVLDRSATSPSTTPPDAARPASAPPSASAA